MALQNSQLSRIFRLVDPNVTIILIVPYQIQIDLLAYYVKMLEIHQVPDVEKRLHILIPVIEFD